ncbi:ComF family protein [Streptomyces somaliensis]|uniref:ComF family protein n=1 Tax=Streptomyces somaliensis TaxID=78355 RepID=UPI003F756FC6
MASAAAGELRRTGVAARVAPVLRQGRAVADQAGLDARERRENLAGALEVVPGGIRLLRGVRVVLVDDVMTTGASLAEAARALYEAGVGPVEGGAARSSAGGDGGVCAGAAPRGPTGVPVREGPVGGERPTGARGVPAGPGRRPVARPPGPGCRPACRPGGGCRSGGMPGIPR